MVFGSLLSLGVPSDPLQIASGLLISTHCSSTVLLVVRRAEKKEGTCNFLIRLNLLILMQLYIWALLLSRVAPPLLHRLRGWSQGSPFDWKKTLVVYFSFREQDFVLEGISESYSFFFFIFLQFGGGTLGYLR